MGNNYFYVEKGNTITKVSIASGNYTTPISVINAINNALNSESIDLTFSRNEITQKVKITNNDATNIQN